MFYKTCFLARDKNQKFITVIFIGAANLSAANWILGSLSNDDGNSNEKATKQ